MPLKKIWLEPKGIISFRSTDNEHVIAVFGEGLAMEQSGWIEGDIGRSLGKIFPDGVCRGDEFSIYREPTKYEIKRLQKLAQSFGAEIEVKIRSGEEFRAKREKDEELQFPGGLRK